MGYAAMGWAVAVMMGATPGVADAPEQVFEAGAYGAVADDAADDGPAIRDAIAAAIDHGPGAVVRLGPGVHRVGPSEAGPAGLNIIGARGLTLEGAPGETELVFTDPRQGGFYIHECGGVFVRGVTVDFDPPPFTQGVIRAADAAAGWFELDLDAGFPSLDAPAFAEAPKPFGVWGLIMEPDRRRIKAGVSDFVFIDRWEHVDGRRWRMHAVADQRGRVGEMVPGDRFVHMARSGTGGIFFSHSRDSGVEDVTLHAAPSLATGSIATDGLVVRRFRVAFREGTRRLLTTNADGVHCQQNLRGPIIEDCSFEGMADDGINIYYYPNRVLAADDARTFRVAPGGIIEPGDRVQFYGPEEGVMRGTARVVEADPVEGGGYVITLDTPVAAVLAAADGGDHLYNLTRCGRGFAIRRNTFRDHRRHGMMIKAPGGVIEDNLLQGCSGYAMVIGNDPEWPEGVAPNDVLVRGNRIENVGYSVWYPGMPRAAAIQVHALAAGGRVAAERFVHSITLADNTIVNPPGAGISLGAVRDVYVVGNAVHFGDAALLEDATAAVELYSVEGVRVADLTVTGEREEVMAAVSADAASAPGDPGVRVDEATVRVPEGDAPMPALRRAATPADD